MSLPRARCAGGRKVLGGATGRPPGAAGEGDAGGQEDGVPPTGGLWVIAPRHKLPHSNESRQSTDRSHVTAHKLKWDAVKF